MRKTAACIILLFAGLITVNAQPVTYRTVAPVIFNKCATCHRAGDAAPFSLTSYPDVRKRISFIKKVITDGYMPPWRADARYRDFANHRLLTEGEKQLLLQWIDNNAPEGTNNAPDGGHEDQVEARRSLLQVTGWYRKPDLTMKLDSAFTVKGDNTERFIVFKLPFEFSEEHSIEAIEFFTNNKKIIHHANYGFYEIADTAVDIGGGPRLVNSADDDRRRPDPYGLYKKKMTYYTGWIPGTSVESYPNDFGWVMPKRGVLLITTHYSASALDEQSIVGVNLFFRKGAVRRPVQIISLGSGGVAESDISPPFFIPRDRVSTFHLKVKTKDEQSLLAVWPHMHLLGKEFFAYAVTPAGDTIHLVHIQDWDFRWQELYKFKNLIRIPKGSVINMDCTYDNTANNPFNPNAPPEGVFSVGDMSSKNEMMTLLLIYVPYREGDEQMVL